MMTLSYAPAREKLRMGRPSRSFFRHPPPRRSRPFPVEAGHRPALSRPDDISTTTRGARAYIMLIFIQPRLVLLSIPKTGTTALEQALAPRAEIVFRARPEIKHLNHRQYLNRIKPLLAPLGGPAFESMAVMREPLDWLRSWYRFRLRDDLIGHENSTAGISFDQFVRDYLRDGRRPPHARLGRQSGFLTDHDDKIAVAHVYRYEAMDLALDFLSRRLGAEITLGRANASPPAATELSPKTEAMARNALAREYEIWQAALH